MSEPTTAETAADTEAGTEAVAAVDAEADAAVVTEAATSPVADAPTRNARKVREGLVTSASMNKTIIVTVTDRVRHAKYNKFVLRSKKLYVHDEADDAGVGDRVRVMETRPMSKNKRWRLVEIIERAR